MWLLHGTFLGSIAVVPQLRAADVEDFDSYKIRFCMSNVQNAQGDSTTDLAQQRTVLAINRTAIAAERTLLAWIRTAIAMIGFGFTIYKFFQYLQSDVGGKNVLHPNAPRNLGLSLIALGTLALAAATWQHRIFLKQLGESRPQYIWSLSFLVAIAVVLMGLLTFYGVLLQHGPY